MLTLAPLLAVTNGMLLMVKGGMFSGTYYLMAFAVFLTMFPMVWFPSFAPMIFATVSGACFFLPGFKAYRRLRHARRLAAAEPARP